MTNQKLEDSMLERTFCHMAGIGEKREQLLWDAGIETWWDALDRALPLSEELSAEVKKSAEIAIRHFERKNPLYFFHTLPSNQLWRLFPTFRERVGYLDIETTGLGGGDAITTMVVYDGREIHPYVQGDNLNDFRYDAGQYELLVTYNGKTLYTFRTVVR